MRSHKNFVALTLREGLIVGPICWLLRSLFPIIPDWVESILLPILVLTV